MVEHYHTPADAYMLALALVAVLRESCLYPVESPMWAACRREEAHLRQVMGRPYHLHPRVTAPSPPTRRGRTTAS
jgi:hypothetical protein